MNVYKNKSFRQNTIYRKVYFYMSEEQTVSSILKNFLIFVANTDAEYYYK